MYFKLKTPASSILKTSPLHWPAGPLSLLYPSMPPLLLSSPPRVCPPQPFSGHLTAEPDAEVWYQRPPVGWTTVSSAAWAPIKALGGLAVTKQFRTSQLFLLERGQGGNRGSSAGGEGRVSFAPQRFPSGPNFTLHSFPNSQDPPQGKVRPS